jgi:hypothetical protein
MRWRLAGRRWVTALAAALVTVALGGAWFAWVSRPPAMSAAETEADLRSYTGGIPSSYRCERQGWPYHWDYTCSWRGPEGLLTTIQVNVDDDSIVEQTAP